MCVRKATKRTAMIFVLVGSKGIVIFVFFATKSQLKQKEVKNSSKCNTTILITKMEQSELYTKGPCPAPASMCDSQANQSTSKHQKPV